MPVRLNPALAGLTIFGARHDDGDAMNASPQHEPVMVILRPTRKLHAQMPLADVVPLHSDTALLTVAFWREVLRAADRRSPRDCRGEFGREKIARSAGEVTEDLRHYRSDEPC
jgi:hypothetical protein